MIKIANNLINLIKTSTTANDVVNMDTFGGGVADYVANGPELGVWGARRAARSAAMADAVGMDPGWLLNHPIKTRGGVGLLGALLGGGLGAGATALGGGSAAAQLFAGLGGGAVGGLAGLIGASKVTRNRMQAINEAVDEANNLRPVAEKGLGIGLSGGPYNLGRVEAEQAINRGGSKEEILQRLVDSANSQGVGGPLGVYGADLATSVLDTVLPGAGLLGIPINLGHGIVHDIKARSLRGDGKKNKKK